LNAEEIAARRVPVEDAEMNLARAKNWHCHYCNHRFKNELTFMKHHCEPKRRAQELMTPIGQAAFEFYREWMRMKKYSQPSAAAFMESKFYRSFLNFAQLVQDANISKPERYMALMIEADILPILWCRDQCYSVYLDYMDKVSDPIEQVQDSINYLLDICEKEGYSLSNVFEKLGAQQVLSLVRQRRLTPWLLFCSPTFGSLLKTLDKHQLAAFNTVVNANYWQERFTEEKKVLDDIRHIVKELGL
jgi:hypothetical protein